MRARALIFTIGLLASAAAILLVTNDNQAFQPVLIGHAPPDVADLGEPEPGSASADVKRALSQIVDLQSRLDAVTTELEIKERDYGLLDREVSRLRQRLAEESEARIVLERKLAIAEENGDLMRPAAEAADPRYRVQYSESAPPPEDAPAKTVLLVGPGATGESEAPEDEGNQFRGTGEFTLHAGDAWMGDGSENVFKVLTLAAGDATRVANAEVDAFGERRVVEQGAQVSRTMLSGLYTLTILRVSSETDVVELLVERDG